MKIFNAKNKFIINFISPLTLFSTRINQIKQFFFTELRLKWERLGLNICYNNSASLNEIVLNLHHV